MLLIDREGKFHHRLPYGQSYWARLSGHDMCFSKRVVAARSFPLLQVHFNKQATINKKAEMEIVSCPPEATQSVD